MRRHHALVALIAAAAALLAACGDDDDASSATTTPATTPATTMPDHGNDHEMDPADRAAAMLATAGYQDVATAEAAGYASSLDTLGCFTDPERGGMGLHYIDESLMDDQVDITKPEALVYELDANGDITGLVAHEYIVPIDAWTKTTPPQLFGMDFHQHPTLPLWVLHAWLWKDNPSRHLPGLEPSRAAVPARRPHLRQGPAGTDTNDRRAVTRRRYEPSRGPSPTALTVPAGIPQLPTLSKGMTDDHRAPVSLRPPRSRQRRRPRRADRSAGRHTRQRPHPHRRPAAPWGALLRLDVGRPSFRDG